MQDPTLLDATASNPLTMDEEIIMQGTWKDDDTKCTFIILARDLVVTASLSSADGAATSNANDDDVDASIYVPPPPTYQTIDLTTSSNLEKNLYHLLIQKTLHAMIGDINLFLSEEEDEEGWDGPQSNGDAPKLRAQTLSSTSSSNSNRYSQAELDIMIASPPHRNKNLGTEATLMMMHYGASKLHLRRFFVKIKNTNLSSLHLFRIKLGFFQVAYVECFGEYELECKCDTWEDMVDWVERKWREVDHCRSGNIPCRVSKDNDFGRLCDNGGTDDDDEVHCRIYDVHNCPSSH